MREKDRLREGGVEGPLRKEFKVFRLVKRMKHKNSFTRKKNSPFQ